MTSNKNYFADNSLEQFDALFYKARFFKFDRVETTKQERIHNIKCLCHRLQSQSYLKEDGHTKDT